MSPPAAAYMRPGAGLYIYICIAGTGSCVHEPIHHIFRSFVGQHRKMGCCPLQNIEVLHLFRWYTHRQTDKQTNRQTSRHPFIHPSIHPSIQATLSHADLSCVPFTISCLFPAFPIPSSPFFCDLLEEVDMWGFPVL